MTTLHELGRWLDTMEVEHETDDGTLGFGFEIQFGERVAANQVLVEEDAGDLVVAVLVEIIDLDDRLPSEIDDDPFVRALYVDAEEDADSGFLVVEARLARDRPVEDLLLLLDSVELLVVDLVVRCVVRLVDGRALDDELADGVANLQELKRRDPVAAVTESLRLAERAEDNADPWLACDLRLVAAEVLGEMGQIDRAWNLLDPVWELQEAPLGRVVVVEARANLLCLRGDAEAALDLVDRALAVVQDDAHDRAFLRGARGSVLARAGRYPEAASELQGAVDDPALDVDTRDRFDNNLQLVRGRYDGSSQRDVRVHNDTLSIADGLLNDISAVADGVMGDPAAVAPKVKAKIEQVFAMWPSLGPLQRSRALMVRAILAFNLGDMHNAEKDMLAAMREASDAGDVSTFRAVRSAMAAFGFLPHDLGPSESDGATQRATFKLGIAAMAFRRLANGTADAVTVAREAREPCLEALRLFDGERFAFQSIVDREAWAVQASKAYEVAMAIAIALGEHDLMCEVLHRVRGQGVLAAASASTEPVAPGREPVALPAVDDRELVMLDGLTSAFGDVAVAPAPVVTVGGRSVIGGTGPRIDLGTIVHTVGGEGAWWWSAHLYANRLYWAVRTPDGSLSSGVDIIDATTQPLDELVGSLGAPQTDADTMTHPLLGDADGRADGILAAIAGHLIPTVLRDACRAAIASGAPLRLVWSPSSLLARVPIGLLPIERDTRLLETAVVTLAPPVSLLLEDRGPAEQPVARELSVVLGADDGRLGGTEALFAGGAEIERDAVLGDWSHVDAGLASGLATPAAVRALWSGRRRDVGLYYGHVDHAVGGTRTSSLRLTDGRRAVPLSSTDLLVPERTGAPAVVVLSGCGSADVATLGSGEWWGVAAGLMWQGADHLVASQWDLVHCEATMRFAREIADDLRTSGDPAGSLQARQLRWLRRWRASRGQPFTRTAADAHPYLWAGWGVTGVRSPALG